MHARPCCGMHGSSTPAGTPASHGVARAATCPGSSIAVASTAARHTAPTRSAAASPSRGPTTSACSATLPPGLHACSHLSVWRPVMQQAVTCSMACSSFRARRGLYALHRPAQAHRFRHLITIHSCISNAGRGLRRTARRPPHWRPQTRQWTGGAASTPATCGRCQSLSQAAAAPRRPTPPRPLASSGCRTGWRASCWPFCNRRCDEPRRAGRLWLRCG